MPDPRHALGARAEQLAAEWLASQGWTILAQRWRCPAGELDLVARDPDGVLVAVEVKARRSGRTGSPLESIDRPRLRRLRAAFGRFAADAPEVAHGGIRIDLVAVWRDADGQWRVGHHPAIDGW
jgi:putative endonuclease